MKKALSILLIFMLILTTIGPLPNVSAATTSISEAIGSEVNLNNKGSITVILNSPTPGEKVLLFNHLNSIVGERQITTSTTIVFENLDPGKYNVRIDGESNNFEAFVRPLPVEAGMVSSPAKSIGVQKAIPGATLVLYRTDKPGFLERTVVADEKGNGSFIIGYEAHQVPPGENYQVKQRINGAESLGSAHFNVDPEPVEISVTSASGKNNDQGSIRVTDTRSGNKLYLYNTMNTTQYIREETARGSEHSFTGLPAGSYYVIQEEDGAKSERSTIVTIADNVDPMITLNVAADQRISITGDPNTYVYKPQASDVTVNDNIALDDESPITWEPLEIKEPGNYTITYTAKDAAGNISTLSRKVTILPPTLTITETINTCIDFTPDSDGFYDCTNPNPWRNTGDIWIDNVMENPNTTIRVYQDPDAKLVYSTQDTNPGSFKIPNIPVGSNYYVTQVVNGVESIPSTRTSILDNTPPKIELKGTKEVPFVRGTEYIEFGANATDNIDNSNDLSAKIVIDTSNVNMNVPGIYYVTYDVTDAAGNPAKRVTREIIVSPHPVIAIGSYADLGEVSVKNAFPGSVLKLYSVTDNEKPVAQSDPLPTGVTTYVFQFLSSKDSNGNIRYDNGKVINTTDKIPPGSYYVVQEFDANGQILKSVNSNIVDVLDTDRPFITLEGSENLYFVWDESKGDYSYDEGMIEGFYTDPGAVANDYLDDPEELTKKIKKKITFGKTIICEEAEGMDDKCPNPLIIEHPGEYKIFYNVTTKRGTKANEKVRTITVAPPKLSQVTSGKSKIDVDGVYNHDTTVVKLYNTYGQLIETKQMKDESDSSLTMFDQIPAGLGYYVTQTVNGIESAASNPVNVSIFDPANSPALITDFRFKEIKATSVVIDQNVGTITVMATSDEIKKATFNGSIKLTPDIKTVGKLKSPVTPDNLGNITGQVEHYLDVPVTYIVSSVDKDNKLDNKTTKEYDVILKETIDLSISKNTQVVSIDPLSNSTQKIALTPAEKAAAVEKGVTFVSSDAGIFIPGGNVKETSSATLSVKKSDDQMEIIWGSRTNTFVQPIEVEVPYTPNKKFAKQITQNGQTYTVIQPTDRAGKNMVGLATESGTYTIVDPVTKPTIQSVGESFKLSTKEAGAKIYYTTNSSDISYDRSTRPLTGFEDTLTLDQSFDLSNWTLYENEPISSSTGEIYAIVVKDGTISPVAYEMNKTPVKWKDDMPTYSKSHILKIKFNARVNRKALYSNEIYVVNDATGETVKTTLSLSDDGQTILVTPVEQYQTGHQYTLVIEHRIKGQTKNNEFLSQPLTQSFKIK